MNIIPPLSLLYNFIVFMSDENFSPHFDKRVEGDASLMFLIGTLNPYHVAYNWKALFTKKL